MMVPLVSYQWMMKEMMAAHYSMGVMVYYLHYNSYGSVTNKTTTRAAEVNEASAAQ
jgi:hypothetical protein